jgi:hypothetical protein
MTAVKCTTTTATLDRMQSGPSRGADLPSESSIFAVRKVLLSSAPGKDPVEDNRESFKQTLHSKTRRVFECASSCHDADESSAEHEEAAACPPALMEKLLAPTYAGYVITLIKRS